MTIFDVLALLGGLAMFLYGMNVMGSGLEKLAGGRLEKILEKITNNPLKGALVGVLITAIVQSSSATTVILVGFVNAGIMKFSQAISIIMGANIGTTITAWILSLAGIEGDALWMNLLKPNNFSPIFAVIGVVMLLFFKNGKKKDIGSILLGFAVLMFGMTSMSNAVKPLESVPAFTDMLLVFSNPLLGVLVGTVLTAIIQSSSASVGILQALSATGSVSYGVAIPIILGQNIGTCATALISCIGASKNAKKTAVVHLLFNIIGALLFMIPFYTINAFYGFSFINNAVHAADIAVIHTVFNVGSTIVLLPFSKYLGRLASLIVRSDDTKEFAPALEDRFLSSPTFALEQCKNTTYEMAQLSKDVMYDALKLFDNFSTKLSDKILEQESIIDKYEDAIGTYLVKLSSLNLSEGDSREASKLLHVIGDLERISDHAVNIRDGAQEMHDKGIRFSQKARQDLDVLTQALVEILELTIQAFVEDDEAKAMRVEPLEQVIDALKLEIKNGHIKRLQEGNCTIEMGFILSDILANYERVSDHCSNIAVCIIQINHASFQTHDYLNQIKNTEHPEFMEAFEGYRQKYTLAQ